MIINTFFSSRGFLFLAGAVYLVTWPGRQHADLVASTVGASLLLILGLIGIATLINGIALIRRVHVEVRPPIGGRESTSNPETELVSGEERRFLLNVEYPFILPLFILEIKPQLAASGTSFSRQRIAGWSKGHTRLFDDIEFPHRGIWRVDSIDLTFSDIFGLTQLRWRQGSDEAVQTIEVSPPREHGTSLPVITSTIRAGDEVADITHRKGEYYDLKPYHPSDGMRKILWKVYARTGELLARHPEPAMTPEGQVFIFAFANKEDDRLCAVAHAYVEELEELGLAVVFGCEGMQNEPLANSRHAARKLMIDSVWNASLESDELVSSDFAHYIECLTEQHRTTNARKLLIFISPERLSSSIRSQEALRIGNSLAAQSIEPVFCLVHSTPGNSGGQGHGHGQGIIPRLIYMQEQNVRQVDPQLYGNFLNSCVANRWDVINA